MSDLSRSLVDAAGVAVYEEIKKWPMPTNPWERSGQVGSLGATQEDVGRAAVAAVLETLAAHYEGPGFLMGPGSLRAVAAEVKTGEQP